MMTIWRYCSIDVVARPPTWMMLVNIGGTGLLRGPCTIWTKLERKVDMPIAEISGARRNEPRSGR